MPPADGETVAPARASGWLASLVIGGVALAVYLANGREIGTYDTIPATLLPIAMARGDGLLLDHFAPLLRESDGRLPDYVARKRGHLVSRYPVAPALVAFPFIWPQMKWRDATDPTWSRHPALEWSHAHAMVKNASACIAALTIALLHRLLSRLVPARAALVAALTAAFGSNLWATASQALWQHGPAALALTIMLLSLAHDGRSWWRLVVAGLAAGALLAIRLVDVLLVLPIVVGIAVRDRRGLLLFLAGLLPLAIPSLAYNIAWFGAPMGGMTELESLHPRLHAVPGPWSSTPWRGLAGTLLSPSRGLFVFSPWVALALVLAPWSLKPLAHRRLVKWALLGLVAYVALLSAYSVWWAGFCFGPRYWTDVMPLFAVLLGCALTSPAARSPVVRGLFGVAIAWSIAVQMVGAWCYPSSWNLAPASVDTHHERLWDWADSELTRCLRESLFLKLR